MYVQHVRIMSSYARVRSIKYMEFIPDSLDSFRGRFRTKRMLKAMTDERIVDAVNELASKARFTGCWARSLSEGNPYFYIGLFVAQLHNVQSLRLDYVLARNYGFLALTLRHVLLHAPANVLSSFKKLAVVEYGGYLTTNFQVVSLNGEVLYMRPELSPNPSLGWFMLPSLRTLEARVGDQELQHILNMTKPSSRRSRSLANLERLVLLSCSAKEHRVAELLSLTPSVTKLHLGLSSWVSQEDDSGKKPLRDGRKLLKSLVGLRKTLEHLSIGLNLLSTQITDLSDLRVCLTPFKGILRKFPTLRTAEIQVTMLLGIYDQTVPAKLAQLLPAGLQSLCIRCYLHPNHDFDLGWNFARIMQCIREFLPHLKASTPRLAQIYIHPDFRFSARRKHWAEILRTRNSARALGLDLCVRVLKPCVLPGLWTRNRYGDARKFIF